MEIDFESWFDIFLDRCKIHHNYNGPIDRGTFEMEYEQGKSPEESADAFVKEMTED